MDASRTQIVAVLGCVAVMGGGALAVQRWPATLNDFRACHTDAECGLAPGCHPSPIAIAKRSAWNAFRSDCHCGPCRFAASAKAPADAWKAWASQVIERKQLCPDDPSTASIVCEKPTGTVCSTVSNVCVMLEPEQAGAARKRK
ncbi:MAG: hypothetical protein JST54_30630 [Deltaproteobacteria bacterium]|nr:hypothetical protein [Deltaproteobacteria bacterium]